LQAKRFDKYVEERFIEEGAEFKAFNKMLTFQNPAINTAINNKLRKSEEVALKEFKEKLLSMRLEHCKESISWLSGRLNALNSPEIIATEIALDLLSVGFRVLNLPTPIPTSFYQSTDKRPPKPHSTLEGSCNFQTIMKCVKNTQSDYKDRIHKGKESQLRQERKRSYSPKKGEAQKNGSTSTSSEKQNTTGATNNMDAELESKINQNGSKSVGNEGRNNEPTSSTTRNDNRSTSSNTRNDNRSTSANTRNYYRSSSFNNRNDHRFTSTNDRSDNRTRNFSPPKNRAGSPGTRNPSRGRQPFKGKNNNYGGRPRSASRPQSFYEPQSSSRQQYRSVGSRNDVGSDPGNRNRNQTNPY
jgi:hypothetical protein